MSTKPQQKKETLWMRFRKWMISLPVLALFGIYSGYANLGVDSLRTEIYQPLYREINTMDDAVQSNLLEKNYSTESYESLRKNGNLLRVPKSLRKKVSRLYELSSEEHSHILPLIKIIAYQMPQQISPIRSQQNDREWEARTTADLNSHLKTPTDVYGFQFSMSHTARGPAISIVNGKPTAFSSPGLVTWELNDWMRFPKSAADLNWPNDWFLSFDEHNDSWYYRITHDDLTRLHMSLEDFLRPMHQTLSSDPQFQQLIQTNKEAIALMDDVKAEIADRINHPRQLRDLIDF